MKILLQLLPTVISCPWWALIERLTGDFGYGSSAPAFI